MTLIVDGIYQVIESNEQGMGSFEKSPPPRPDKTSVWIKDYNRVFLRPVQDIQLITRIHRYSSRVGQYKPPSPSFKEVITKGEGHF